jgi:hypothetical protein
MVMRRVFCLFFSAWAAVIGAAQEGGGWVEKPLAFSAFYTCTAGAGNGGGIEGYLENSLDEIRPLALRLLHDGPYSSKEMTVAFATRGGETVSIHLYFADFQNGTYTLKTAAEQYPSALFKNCGGNFRMYPLEGNSSTFEFVLYNEMGRPGDGIYAAFDIDSSLLYF